MNRNDTTDPPSYEFYQEDIEALIAFFTGKYTIAMTPEDDKVTFSAIGSEIQLVMNQDSRP